MRLERGSLKEGKLRTDVGPSSLHEFNHIPGAAAWNVVKVVEKFRKLT